MLQTIAWIRGAWLLGGAGAMVGISAHNATGIIAATLIVLGLAVLTSWAYKRFTVHVLELLKNKLQQSEAYLSEAQRLSHTGSFGWKVATGEIIWSDETFRIFEYPRTLTPAVELVLQRIHPEDVDLARKTIERVSQHAKDFDLEHRLLMPDGSVKYVHVVARALGSAPDNIEFFGAVMDITERKQAEEGLRASERNFRLLVEAIPGMVGINTAEGQNEYTNQRVLDYTGKTREEMTDFGWIEVFHPDDVDRVLTTWLQSVDSGEPHESEFRLRSRDGVYRWFHSRAEPSRDNKGRITRWYSLIYDIDDRKNAEETLRKTQFELAHVSRVMTMGELVASIAHEVNQPLGSIVTNGQACLRLLSQETPDITKSCEIIERTISEGVRASEVIKRIRNLLHKNPAEKTLLDINETIQEVVSLVEPDLVRSQVELKVNLAADLPSVTGDRIQLQQVILNLILNGKDAMSDLQNQPRELLITSGQSLVGEVIVSVRDSGAGLDPKIVDRIFDPFVTSKAEGMGLGLSISRTIVEAHGGRLRATANNGKGATLQFSLPQTAVNPDKGKVCSLVSDDDSQDFDCLVADLEIPGLSGLEFQRRLAAHNG